jgi:23S rRNA pseudouridine1911/1915/1917 synthase
MPAERKPRLPLLRQKANPMIELIVSEHEAGQRIDQYLATIDAVGTRSQAAKLIDQGAVSLNDGAVKKRTELQAGDVIKLQIEPAPFTSSEPAVPFDIVFEDTDLIVVDKPAGLVVHPAPGNRSGTLAQALAGRAAGGDPERPGIVHRLDKETSGLLVVAKNDDALRTLQAAIKDRSVRRQYTALVKGRPETSTGTIDAPLGRDRRNPESIAIREDSDRDAITHFEVVEEIGERTLMHVRLETGRTHQIRVHLAAIDLPVCGDPQYGRGVVGDLGLERQFLHASELSFRHPVSEQPLSFASPLPPDLEAALNLAR